MGFMNVVVVKRSDGLKRNKRKCMLNPTDNFNNLEEHKTRDLIFLVVKIMNIKTRKNKFCKQT